MTESVAKEIARETVSETFRALGIDVTDADEIRHFQANMAWVFKFRRLSEKIGTTILLTLATIITGGFAKIIWDALKAKGGP